MTKLILKSFITLNKDVLFTLATTAFRNQKGISIITVNGLPKIELIDQPKKTELLSTFHHYNLIIKTNDKDNPEWCGIKDADDLMNKLKFLNR